MTEVDDHLIICCISIGLFVGVHVIFETCLRNFCELPSSYIFAISRPSYHTSIHCRPHRHGQILRFRLALLVVMNLGKDDVSIFTIHNKSKKGSRQAVVGHPPASASADLPPYPAPPNTARSNRAKDSVPSQ